VLEFGLNCEKYYDGNLSRIKNEIKNYLPDIFVLGVTARGAKHPEVVPFEELKFKKTRRLRRPLRSLT